MYKNEMDNIWAVHSRNTHFIHRYLYSKNRGVKLIPWVGNSKTKVNICVVHSDWRKSRRVWEKHEAICSILKRSYFIHSPFIFAKSKQRFCSRKQPPVYNTITNRGGRRRRPPNLYLYLHILFHRLLNR